jgi:hypothetical protein
MRAIAGIIVGLIAGFLVTLLAGIIGVYLTFSPPAATQLADARQVIAIFATMPMAAKIALIVAWFLGALAGAAVAKRISRQSWVAWLVAALITLYVLLNTLVMPLPGWMQALSIVAPLIGGLIGNHLVGGMPTLPPEAAATTDA